MHFALLRGSDFRLFEQFELAPGPRLNWIHGDNAAGKTTLLEAVYCAGRGRSFRGATTAELGRYGASGWHLRARIVRAGQPARDLALAGTGESLALEWVPGGTAGIVDLVREVPVQVIEPSTHKLVEEGPAYRRRFLDWGVFHVEPEFYPAWRRYARALKQRNRALKARAPAAEIRAWDGELVLAGNVVHGCRERHVAALRAGLGATLAALLGPVEWQLHWLAGWNRERPFAEALEQHLATDQTRGSTGVGPHRSELRLSLFGHAVRHRVSRGQQKLLTSALVLAQAAIVREARGQAPVLLLDDFPAELGPDFQQRLLEQLQAYPGQVFVTALAAPASPQAPPGTALFHVEQGQFRGRSVV